MSKLSMLERIKEWFSNHPNEWLSTRELRQLFGESADRRVRSLKSSGFEIVSKRRELPDGRFGFTFYWAHPEEEQLRFC